jgi:hypothetical protein
MGEKLDSYIDDHGQTVRDGDIVLIANKKWKVEYISHHYVNLSAFPSGGWVHHPFCCSKPSKFLEEQMKQWKDMSPEEKGALLLAHHEGKVIQVRDPFNKAHAWENTLTPHWAPDFAYRVKPKPVVEQVVLLGAKHYFGSAEDVSRNSPYKITFTIVDGETDCSSIKMEKLK